MNPTLKVFACKVQFSHLFHSHEEQLLYNTDKDFSAVSCALVQENFSCTGTTCTVKNMHVFPVGKGRGKTCSSLSKSCKGNSVCIVLPSFLVVCNKLVLCCLKFLSEIISKDRVKCHFYPVTRLYISCPGEPAAASVLWKND